MGKEKTEKVYTNPVRCKGCGYCINACPQEAISVSDHVNAKGYNTIVVDEEKCVVCVIVYARIMYLKLDKEVSHLWRRYY